MEEFEAPLKRTEAEWDALPPLVAKGQDRAARLADVVRAWSTPSPAVGPTNPEGHAKAGGFTLDGIDLVDANSEPPTPIDLGELLLAVEQTLRENGEPEDFQERLDVFVVLRSCRVRECKAGGVKIRPRWTAISCRFDAPADFTSSIFGFGASFESGNFHGGAKFGSATFGDYAGFSSATFGDKVEFKFAAFGTHAQFTSAKMGHEADFTCATFGESAKFSTATFGDNARFVGAVFRNKSALGAFAGAQFDSVSFGKQAYFSSATFGEGANFTSAAFGDEAHFGNATFGPNTNFTFATFGDNAYFICSFGRMTDFSAANFGRWASFSLARFNDFGLFMHTRFGEWAQFKSATFGIHASFYAAMFGPHANFRDARFGPGGGPGGISVASVHYHAPKRKRSRTWQERVRVRAIPVALERARRWVFVRGSWNFVRAAGESAILNRVSMLALVIVPFVAGAWPAVRSLVNGYAFGLGGAKGVYESARSGLLLDASRVPGAESVPNIVAKLDARVDGIAHDLQQAAEGTVPLPLSWGLLFFGALAVTLGRTVYGWGAPEEVRLRGREAAMAAGAAEFREKKDQRRDLILRAITRLQEAAKQLPEIRHPTFVSRHGAAVWVPQSMEEFDEFENTHAKDLESRKSAAGDPEKLKSLRPPLAHTPGEMEILLIEEGEAAQYDLKARESQVPMHIATFLYGTGLYSILWLITHQASSILRQTGSWTHFWPDHWWDVGWRLAVAWVGLTIVMIVLWLVARIQRRARVG